MKTKFLYSLLAFFMAFAAVSCSDEENYSSNTGVLISDSNVTTGVAEVCATSAKLNGSVTGLESQSPAAYETGFLYGYSADNLTEKVIATGPATTFLASVEGVTGQLIYYQAYVTLQGRVTYKGKVLTAELTNAKANTGAYQMEAFNTILSATYTENQGCKNVGIVISGDGDINNAKLNGVKYAATESISEATINVGGFVPGKTYYYTAYIDLGNGVVYGETKSFVAPSLDFNIDDEFVDLGLSTKWAKRNIGAATPSDFGGLYGFGDVVGFNSSINPDLYASSNTYKTERDIAYVAYDGKAMLPTADEYEELFRCCTVEFTTMDNVNGYKFTGPNGNSIFLPCAGSRTESTFSGIGSDGHYMTGSVNPSDSRFFISYDFNSAYNGRGSQPVYTALSARAVTTAKNVPFDKTKLYQKWYLDNGQDGKQHVFEGPFTQWGVHDTYGTVTNGEPNIYENIHWEMGKDNGWIGYTYGKDYGYMEFKEDGTVNIHRIAEDGTVTDEVATYTLDLNAKTITIDADVIAANTWLGTKKGTLNILSLTDNQLQIALPDGAYGYSLNYFSETKRLADETIAVNLLCVGGDWNGTWGTQVGAIEPGSLNGTHTFKYEGSCTSAMVFTLDFAELLAKYPNATVSITDMKCDGNSIAFDGNKFRYGNIEDNGNFRVELFNIWGKASQGGKVDSPFSDGGLLESDPAFNFAESLEITYNININGQQTYTPNLITINPSWGGDWGYSDGTTFDVKINPETAMYEVSQPSLSMTLKASGMDAGSIMTFVQTNDLYLSFPNIKMSLDKVVIDGTALSGWDAAKVVNTSADGGGVNHRLELWNMYGETSQGGCAFGAATADGVITKLGFASSMQLDFSVKSLF